MLTLEIFITFFLTGLIWTIQRVHYPSFIYIDNKDYLDFQYFHMRRITQIVAPLMLTELALSLVNLYKSSFEALFIINTALVVLIWLNTFFWNIPLHKKLTLKKEPLIIKELVISNWPRTILWTIKSLLLLYYPFQL